VRSICGLPHRLHSLDNFDAETLDLGTMLIVEGADAHLDQPIGKPLFHDPGKRRGVGPRIILVRTASDTRSSLANRSRKCGFKKSADFFVRHPARMQLLHRARLRGKRLIASRSHNIALYIASHPPMSGIGNRGTEGAGTVLRAM
jgi:hypothetical protein